jgi:hypothetical protein
MPCWCRLTGHQGFLIAMQPLIDQLRSVLDRMLQGAFPDDSYTPTKSSERFHVSPVTIDIVQKFSLPEFYIGTGGGGVTTSFVSMPEAAVDENHRSVFGEYEIGRAWQFLDMKSIAEPFGEKSSSECSFWPSVLAADARHHSAALRGGLDAHDFGGIPSGCRRNYRFTYLLGKPIQGRSKRVS